MSKKKMSKQEEFSQNIREENIGNKCIDLMKIFGANKNIMRHVPLEIDGLLPGERRLLFAMHNDKKLRYDKKYLKLASIIGSGTEYHPHGDTNIYNTAVKLSQYWNNTVCLIDGHGNFGGENGSSAAAARYLEARLSLYAHKCFFEEFDKDLVDMKPTYSGQGEEPEYLPARYPNLLFKNTYGIGYGLFASIPTYNFKEVCEFVLELMDDPDYNTILYPDIPSGCDVIDDGQFLEIAKTGKGSFRMKSVVEVLHEESIIKVKNAPLMSNLRAIQEKIVELGKSGEIQGLSDIKDRCTHTTVGYDFIFKKGSDLNAALDVMYKKGGLIASLPIRFNIIDDNESREYNLHMLLSSWLDIRRDTKRRLMNKSIVKKNERIHMLDTLIFILSGKNGEKTVKIIKTAENTSEIIDKLMSNYGITSLQARTIANMSMSAFSKDSFKRYTAERETLQKEVDKLMKISKSPKKIDKIIKDELKEGIQLFGTDRKSNIVTFEGKRVVRDTNHVLIFTRNGLVKKLTDNAKNIGYIAQGDYPIEILNINNRDSVLIFDQTGRVSNLAVDDILATELANPGNPINNFAPVNGKIVTVIPKPTEEQLKNIDMDQVRFLLCTRSGIIKRTLVKNFLTFKKDKAAINIGKDDELMSVKLLYGDKDVVIYTNHGMGVRIPSDSIREVGPTAMGVKAMELDKNDFVTGMNIIGDKDKFIFIITNKGKAKKCSLETFATMKRNDKPLRVSSLDSNEEIITIVPVRGNELFKVYMKLDMKEVSISDIPEMTRLAKAKKIIPVKTGDCIVDVKLIGRLK